MRDTFEYLSLLFTLDEKLRGHPGYPEIKKALAREVKDIEESFAPVPHDVFPSVAVFPEDSGVIQKETEAEVQPSDRRF